MTLPFDAGTIRGAVPDVWRQRGATLERIVLVAAIAKTGTWDVDFPGWRGSKAERERRRGRSATFDGTGIRWLSRAAQLWKIIRQLP